jgi:DNA-directed RNA polymerase subunit M/transcription elongation factor TFIIS
MTDKCPKCGTTLEAPKNEWAALYSTCPNCGKLWTVSELEKVKDEVGEIQDCG